MEIFEAMPQCIACSGPLDENDLSFEQRLIRDADFCRKCFDDIMKDEGMTYLDNSRFLSVTR